MQTTDLIIQQANQCVQCGLCLPHCPTYRVHAVESESPRGRIALMKALHTQALIPTLKAVEYLDHCLMCGLCAQVCPSDVNYLKLFSHFKQHYPALQKRKWRQRALRYVITHAYWFAQYLGIIPRSLLFAIAKACRHKMLAIHQLCILLAVSSQKIHADNYHKDTELSGIGIKPEVLLFQGCVTAIAEHEIMVDVQFILQKAGIAFEIIEKVCCGALDVQAGDENAQQRQAMKTQKQLQIQKKCWPNLATLIHINSGCDHALRTITQTEQMRCMEMTQFLANHTHISVLPKRELNLHVALLVPCTQNDIDQGQSTLQLVKQIPGIRVSLLPLQPRCCGAAGLHCVNQPQTANALRDERIVQIQQLKPDIVITTNSGCRLFLQAGLQLAQSSCQVMHPVSLLAQVL